MRYRHSSPDWGTPTPRARAAYGRAMVRVVNHRTYGLVVVYEQPATMERPKTLVFDSPATCIRIDDYPSNWQSLPTEELLGLVLIHSQ